MIIINVVINVVTTINIVINVVIIINIPTTIAIITGNINYIFDYIIYYLI